MKNLGSFIFHDLAALTAARKFSFPFLTDFPLLRAQYGDTQTCSIPQHLRKALNPPLKNCFSSSETISSGKPNLMNTSVNAMMTSREVTSCEMYASG